jgi:hypothetical protein
MFSDYRAWLESELKLLGNASHHAYSFGQANMAKRALERLDHLTEGKVPIVLPRPQALEILTALEMLGQRETALDPALDALRETLKTAMQEGWEASEETAR